MGIMSGLGSLKTGNTGSQNFSWFGQGGESGAVHDKDFVGKAFDNINPTVKAGKAAKEKAKADAERYDQYYKQQGTLNTKLNSADALYAKNFGDQSQDYLKQGGYLVNQYTGEINKLKDETQNQAKDAKSTYTNTILPELKNVMGMAKTNAEGAMTLKEASDPNNPVMKAIRELYNQQGESARKQGQQDFGVLSALGAQAAQGQFGGASPMTAGMMGQIYAQNQGQAGDAYARAQQRMYDLQQQGLDKSFDQSNYLYEQGQQAQDRYGNSIKDIDQAEANYLGKSGMLNDQIAGYAGDIFGTNAAYNADKFNIGQMGNDIAKGNTYASTGRESGLLGQKYGFQQGAADAELARQVAGRQGEMKFLSSLASMGAGMYGGGAGKVAQAGQAGMSNVTQTGKPNSGAQYSNYA